MRHHHEAPLPGLQEAFQPQQGRQIEMVAWLIQQQQIGLLDQRAGEQQTSMLSAAQGGGLLLGLLNRKTHFSEQSLRLPAQQIPFARRQFFQYHLQ